MKSIFSMLAVLLATSLVGQEMSPRFQMAMGKQLGQYGKCESAEDFAELSAGFDRIAKKEVDQWLPQYYAVHTLVLASFTTQNPTAKEQYLDQAQSTMDALLISQADNAEVHVLHGMFHTARLVVDPASRGQKYSALSAQAVGTAKGLDPMNPRVAYMEIANGMGTAQFFGSDISQYCQAAKAAHAAFDDYPVPSRIHPNWGKEQLAEQATACER